MMPDMPRPGVVIAAPGRISDSIKNAVATELAKIPPDGGHAVELIVDLQSGVNIVYAFRKPGDQPGEHTEVGVWGRWDPRWVGKSWDSGLAGGVRISKVWV